MLLNGKSAGLPPVRHGVLKNRTCRPERTTPSYLPENGGGVVGLGHAKIRTASKRKRSLSSATIGCPCPSLPVPQPPPLVASKPWSFPTILFDVHALCLLGQAENIPLRIGGIALAVSSTKKLFVPACRSREINISPTGTLASFERLATLRSATFQCRVCGTHHDAFDDLLFRAAKSEP